MKIVQVEDFWHPDAGYQVNILSKYFVNFGHEVTVIAAEMNLIPHSLTSFFGTDDIPGKDRSYSEKHNVKIIRLPAKKYVSGRVIYDKKQLIDTINAEDPDIVYAHGNDTFTAIQIIRNHKKFRCPVVSDSHMVEMGSSNKFRKLFRLAYRILVTPIIVRNKIRVIRTADDPYVNTSFKIPYELAPYISFGSDTLLFHPDSSVKTAKRIEYGIDDDAFVVVYAGKLGGAKGGMLLADLTCADAAYNRKVCFVVVGTTDKDEYGKEVEARFAQSKRLLRFPTQKYEDLAQFYQLADIAVIPSQCSLSIYDMQACGLPVLAEDNSINIQRLSCGNGWVFRQGDLDSFRDKLADITNLTDDEFRKYSNNALNNITSDYDYSKRAREYEQVLLMARKEYLEKK